MNTLLISTTVLAVLAMTFFGVQYAMVTKQQALEEANKLVVMNGLQELFGKHDLTAIDRYWGETYIQHNPMAADGREALRGFMQQLIDSGARPEPIEFARVSAEGDLVWVHYKLNFMGADTAVVDILRVKDGKMVEHWDVLQAVPETAMNNNTMF